MAFATVTIDGFLSKDAEIRFTQSGHPYVTFSIPVTPQRKTDSGWENTGPTQWYDCTLWGPLGEAIVNGMVKGTHVVLTGNLTAREHEGRTFQQVRVEQIGVIEKRAGNSGAQTFTPNQASSTGIGQAPSQPAQGSTGWTNQQTGQPTNPWAEEPPF